MTKNACITSSCNRISICCPRSGSGCNDSSTSPLCYINTLAAAQRICERRQLESWTTCRNSGGEHWHMRAAQGTYTGTRCGHWHSYWRCSKTLYYAWQMIHSLFPRSVDELIEPCVSSGRSEKVKLHPPYASLEGSIWGLPLGAKAPVRRGRTAPGFGPLGAATGPYSGIIRIWTTPQPLLRVSSSPVWNLTQVIDFNHGYRPVICERWYHLVNELHYS
jgi:hypothetical protein